MRERETHLVLWEAEAHEFIELDLELSPGDGFVDFVGVEARPEVLPLLVHHASTDVRRGKVEGDRAHILCESSRKCQRTQKAKRFHNVYRLEDFPHIRPLFGVSVPHTLRDASQHTHTHTHTHEIFHDVRQAIIPLADSSGGPARGNGPHGGGGYAHTPPDESPLSEDQ